MVIAGLNKLTLTDYPGKVACIVFFAGCNFRCPFCHNSLIASARGGEQCAVSQNALTQEEIFSFLNKRKNVLEGVVLSGGEPLLNNMRDFVPFVQKIKSLGFKVKLDTNGSFPQKLKTILESGLIDHVAMDIKNSPSKYSETAGVAVNLEDIKSSIALIKNSGAEYEFRTTLVKDFHTDSDLEELGAWLKNEDNYYLQEFVNSGALFDNTLSALNMANAKTIVEKHIPKVKTR